MKLEPFLNKLFPGISIVTGLRNLSFLTIGNIISIIINFFGFIVFARILGPSELGVYGTVGSFVGIFSLFFLRGINTVVLREGAKEIGRLKQYYEKTIGLKVFFTIISILLCIGIALFMPYGIREKFFIVIFSITLVYRSFEGYLGSAFQAADKMYYNAALLVFNRLLFIPTAIITLYLGYGLFGLFIVSILSQFVTLIGFVKLSRKIVVFKYLQGIFWNKKLLKSTFIFSILEFTTLLATKIDIVMLSIMSNSTGVGLYLVAFQIVESFIVVRNLTSMSFFPTFVKMFHKKKVKWLNLIKISVVLGSMVLIVVGIISIFSEQIVVLLVGEKYSSSGSILSILLFYIAFTFFTIPLISAMKATNNEGLLLKISWIGPTLNIGFNIVFFYMFGIIGIAYSTLLSSIIKLPVLTFIVWKTLKKQDRII